jgi:hypothetical protein
MKVKWILWTRLWGWQASGTESGLCGMAAFVVSSIQLLGPAITVLEIRNLATSVE